MGAPAESGDVIQALHEGATREDRVRGEIGLVLAGRIPGRTGSDDATLFKSLGIAVGDVATAVHVHALARGRSVGGEIDRENA